MKIFIYGKEGCTESPVLERVKNVPLSISPQCVEGVVYSLVCAEFQTTWVLIFSIAITSASS